MAKTTLTANPRRRPTTRSRKEPQRRYKPPTRNRRLEKEPERSRRRQT